MNRNNNTTHTIVCLLVLLQWGCTTVGTGLDGSLGDDAGDRQIGYKLDNDYRLTVYHHAEESNHLKGERTWLYSHKTCEPIAEIGLDFKKQLQLQGSGSLLDGRVVTFIAECQGGCDTYCYELVGQDAPFGKGANNKPVIPFRTVAVDADILALGRSLYIPELDGATMPGPYGFEHNGCVVAGDTGSAIKGQDLDFFTPTQEDGTHVELSLKNFVNVSRHGHGNPNVNIYQGGNHCRNFGEDQGWIGDPCVQELDCMEGLSCEGSIGAPQGMCTLKGCDDTCPDLYEGGYSKTRCVLPNETRTIEDVGPMCAVECSPGTNGEAPCRAGLTCQDVTWIQGGTQSVCI